MTLSRYAKAFQVLESHLARRRDGCAESREELLAGHAELADVLAPMLEDADGLAVAPAGPPPSWHGLPSEGDEIGGYTVLRLLGQGGMGIVFAARDRQLQREVALKVVRPERLGSATARERFAREAKLAARIEHPHICPIYEVGEANGMPFMAMRLVRGRTLAADLDAQPAPAGENRERLDTLLERIEKVARALHFAHEHGVVHRDIKPGNVLITADGEPIVLDFGMARTAADDEPLLTLTGDVAGTPAYMAPEQVRGKAPADPRTDVFALGVLLYECVTGQRPFAGQSLRELQDAILRTEPPAPSTRLRNLPRDLDAVIDKALAKAPTHRYATAAAFADDVARIRRREPVLARRPGPVLRLSRWAQRNPLAVALLGAGAAMLAVTTWLWLRGDAWQRSFRLAALVPRLEELHLAEPRLFEDWPPDAADLRSWLADAASIATEMPRARAALRQFAASDTPEDRFLHDMLVRVVDAFDALAAEPGGAIARVRKGMHWLAREADVSIHAPEHAAAWKAATAAIATDPRYRGLQLRPQVGLVPIGPDPTTRLVEFHHVRSGSRPMRDDTGRLRVTDDTGIVFVLLPGGRFTMGNSGDDDPLTRPEERPAHEIELAPFFLGKHELTQGQWQRLGDGTNPSEFRPGGEYRLPVTLAHPVEQVQWPEAMTVLTSCGLTLPTEAQWEYACRGATTTAWWTGPAAESVNGRANLADRTAWDLGVRWQEIDRSLDDGFALHAPVDTLEPNGFGLFHITGNVWEWCRDVYHAYDGSTVAAGDGLRTRGEHADPDAMRVVRGGAYDSTVVHVRSALRRQSEPALRDRGTGLRAARPIR